MLPSGKPLRLYPIPYRYLEDGHGEQFKLYHWTTADILKSPNDDRPGSFKIDYDSIESGMAPALERSPFLRKIRTGRFSGGHQVSLGVAIHIDLGLLRV